ncbi:MAG: hypothetical protein K8R38_04920 [Verrucomicrobia bacterium]|nr:hypothetical protein [Verrucomicrobiota bacterium]
MNPKDDLSDLLQSWQPDVEPSSGFNRGVWSRIEASQTRYTESLYGLFSPSHWIQSMGRPRIAIAAAAIALFGGVLIGGVQAHSSQEERYLTSLNPLTTHRSSAHHTNH